MSDAHSGEDLLELVASVLATAVQSESMALVTCTGSSDVVGDQMRIVTRLCEHGVGNGQTGLHHIHAAGDLSPYFRSAVRVVHLLVFKPRLLPPPPPPLLTPTIPTASCPTTSTLCAEEADPLLLPHMNTWATI